MPDELTDIEKVALLAVKDRQNLDDIDQEFLHLLETTESPNLLMLDPSVRQAITQFIPQFWSALAKPLSRTVPNLLLIHKKTNLETVTLTAMTLSLLLGYELGRRLQRPLTVNSSNQNKEKQTENGHTT